MHRTESTEIREAALSDAEMICSLHKQSIRRLCGEAYTQEQIDSWAGPRVPEDYVNFLRTAIVFVVERLDNLVGFAILSDTGELHALYIHPSHVGVGFGSRLLSVVEKKASDLELQSVTLNATLNSVTFYERQGYSSLGETTNTLPNGVELPCVRMKKVLI